MPTYRGFQGEPVVIRDNEEERAARIEELLQQLQEQVAEMKRLEDRCRERAKQSRQLLQRSAWQTNRDGTWTLRRS